MIIVWLVLPVVLMLVPPHPPHPHIQVIKNPITDHLPVGCMKIRTSFAAEEVVDLRTTKPAEGPIVFAVGAMARDQVMCLKMMV